MILKTFYATKEEAQAVAYNAEIENPGHVARVLHRIPVRGAAGPWCIEMLGTKPCGAKNCGEFIPKTKRLCPGCLHDEKYFGTLELKTPARWPGDK
jgi:hypothetical protein